MPYPFQPRDMRALRELLWHHPDMAMYAGRYAIFHGAQRKRLLGRHGILTEVSG